MALIDPSIYQNAPQSLLRAGLNGYDSAMKANDASAQRRDAEAQRKRDDEQRRREQSFKQNLSGLMGSYGEYGHTPEGQREIFDHMAKAGYGQEMIGLMGGIPMQAQPKPTEYDFREGGDGLYATNKSNPSQSIKVPGFTPKPDASKTPTRQLHQNKQGVYTSIDPATGLDLNGRPVEAMPPQATPWSAIVVTNPDGSSKTVFVDPRNPRRAPIDPNLPKTGNQDGIDIPGLTPIPGAKITKDSVKKLKDQTSVYEDLKKQIANYQGMYEQFGTELTGSNADVLRSAATGIKLALKELQNLGVLNGPDLGLMNFQVPDAAGLMAKGRSFLNPALGDPVKARLGQLSKMMDMKYDTAIKANGFARGGESQPAAAPAGGPQPGMVEDGYRFKGGNPADPKNWEKQ